MLQVAKMIVLLLIIVACSEAGVILDSAMSPMIDGLKSELDSSNSISGESDETNQLFNFRQSRSVVDDIYQVYSQGKKRFAMAVNRYAGVEENKQKSTNTDKKSSEAEAEEESEDY